MGVSFEHRRLPLCMDSALLYRILTLVGRHRKVFVMAGYIFNKTNEVDQEFHIDTPDLVKRLHEWNDSSRVMTLQLDGDELAAALWGLDKYTKSNDELSRILYDMDLPTRRLKDYEWLWRNMGLYNRDHPKFDRAMQLIWERKKNNA